MDGRSDVTIRPFEDGDMDEVAEITRQTWLSDVDLAVGSMAARIIVEHYLIDHEWGLVALAEGQVVGVILAGLRETDHSARWQPLIDESMEEARRTDPSLPDLLLKAAGDEIVEARITSELKASGRAESDATIQLLLLAPQARGKHIGGRLFDDARAWMRSQGARGYFLMTDDSCDVSFYDHKGLSRRDTTTVDHGGKPFNIYVYGELL